MSEFHIGRNRRDASGGPEKTRVTGRGLGFVYGAYCRECSPVIVRYAGSIISSFPQGRLRALLSVCALVAQWLCGRRVQPGLYLPSTRGCDKLFSGASDGGTARQEEKR